MPELDTLMLSRIQFGFTIGFHILFPTLTIGLGWFLVTVEALWLKTGNPVYVGLYRLWAKIFALTFGMGVVSGIVLSYQVRHQLEPVLRDRRAGHGAAAVGGGADRLLRGGRVHRRDAVRLEEVGPRLHFLATLLVSLGTLNSAFWILSANSWMQTPAGPNWSTASSCRPIGGPSSSTRPSPTVWPIW